MRLNRALGIHPLAGLERVEVIVGVHLVSTYRFASVIGAAHCHVNNVMAVPIAAAMKWWNNAIDLIRIASRHSTVPERDSGIAVPAPYGFPCAWIRVCADLVESDQLLRLKS